MIKPLHSFSVTANWNMRTRPYLFRILMPCCIVIVLSLATTVVHAQIITETFEENSATSLGIVTLTTGVTATTSSTGGTKTSAGISVGTSSQFIPASALASTATIEVTNYSQFSITKTTSTTARNGNRFNRRTDSYSYTEGYVTTATNTTSTVTDGPDSTGILAWYYGGNNTSAVILSSNTTGFHSGDHFLVMSGGNGGSFIVTPIISGGIASITFWARNAGTSNSDIFVGIRTNTATDAMYPTYFSCTKTTNNTGGVCMLFSTNTSSLTLSSTGNNAGTFSTYNQTLSSELQSNGNTFSGTNTANNGKISLHRTQFTYAVPTNYQHQDAQAVIANYGGDIEIDDIEIFGHIGITLGANPSTCYSATASVTASLPFYATQAGPTEYKINGWSNSNNDADDNFTNMASYSTLGTAPGTISITVPANTAPGTYTASLYVSDGTSVSTAYPISVTVNATPGITTVPSHAGGNAIAYYKFNGDVKDTVNFNNGTVVGSPSYTTNTDRFGNTNSAITLDGTDYLYTANSISMLNTANFSLSVWFKTTVSSGTLIGFTNTQTGTITNADRQLYLYKGQVVFGVYNGGVDTVTSSGTYNDGNWHMATGTFSSSTGVGMTLYVDGVKVAANTGYKRSTTYSGYWRLGETSATVGNNYFTGALDDAVISSSVTFSAAEVAGLYTGLFPSSNTPVCIGNTLNLYEPLAGTGYSYSWTGPNSFADNSEDPTIPGFSTAAIGTYSITVNGPLGCAVTSTTASTITSTITAAESTNPVTGSSSVPNTPTSYYSYTKNSITQPDSITATVNTGTFQRRSSGFNYPTLTTDRYGADSAYNFSSSDRNFMSTTINYGGSAPTVFSLSIWFNTSTTTLQPLIGFGNSQTGSSTTFDRTIYMDGSGRIIFYTNIKPSTVDSIGSPLGTSYADGTWHLATATCSASGLTLYIDGAVVAYNKSTPAFAGYTNGGGGYWKVGSTTTINTTNTQSYFDGDLDDIAIYSGTALTASQVSQLYSGTTTDQATNSICQGYPITLSEKTITGATSYTWTRPDGTTYSGQTLPITSPTNENDSGTYTVLIKTSIANSCPALGSVSVAVNVPTITLASATGTDAQAVCNTGSPITNIVYAVGGTGTGLKITNWSPSTPAWADTLTTSGGIFTISGTPTATGVYTYTLSTTGGSCDAITTTGSISTGVSDTWVGGTSDLWSDATNWSCGLPTTTSDVIIPDVTTLGDPEPVLDVNATVNDISFQDNNSILDMNGQVFTINGAISGNGMIGSSSTASGLIMGPHSSGTLSFAGGLNTIDSLRLVDGANITLGSPLNITSTGILRVGTITGTGATLVSNGELTLLSDDAGSAQVAPVPNDYGSGYTSSITGIVNVQCYVHSSNNDLEPGARRAWRLLTAPVTNNGLGTSTSIYTSWQNGGVYTPGVGTMITMPPSANYSGSGLDDGVNGSYSAYTWSITGQKLTPVNNTTSTDISNAAGGSALDNIAYFIFVRGDRDPNTIKDPSVATINNTTLNAPGILQLGTKTFNSGTSLGPNALMMVGNPYASAVNFKLIAADTAASAGYTSGLTNLVNRFYFWNANLPGSSNVGGYVCVDDAGNSKSYTENINDTTVGIGAANYSDLNIQSGQAFFVQSSGGVSSIAIKEVAKTTAINFIFRPEDEGVATSPAIESFAATLALLNGNSAQAPCDGIVAQFNNNYSDTVDYLDAPKFGSFDESFSLARNGQQLCIERRADINAATKDTLFLNLTQIQQRSYQFKFNGGITNRPGVGVHLEDAYTGAHTPLSLNGTVPVNFTIDGNAASQAQNRFMVVFGAVNIIPVYTAITATQQANTILVQWSLSNDQSMGSYALQKSTDGGVTYTTVYTITANHTTGAYSWTDVSPVVGNNYYRIISTDTLSETSYSPVVSAAITSLEPSGTTVYPNPIQGHQINIALNNMAAGIYYYKIYNMLGHELQTGDFTNASTNAGYTTISIDKALARGTYRLEIVHPDKTSTSTDFVY